MVDPVRGEMIAISNPAGIKYHIIHLEKALLFCSPLRYYTFVRIL